MNKLLIFILFFSCSIQAMDAFIADYEVYRDGKKTGLSSTELKQEGTLYSLTDKTNGTHGMASFLGFKRFEQTTFYLDNERFSPQTYKMSQKVAFKKRQSSFAVSSDTDLINGKYKDKSWQMKRPETFTTTNLTSLQLSSDICDGKTSNLSYPTIKNGKIKNYRFVITDQVDNIIEIDKVHSKSSRVTKTWLDKNQNCLPIRTYHVEEGKAPIETKLINIQYQ